MKKFILTLVVVVATLCSYATKEVNTIVLKSFNSEFTGAKDVQWTANGNHYKASFVFNNQYVMAFYANTGELMAVTRNLTSLELPIKLQTSLKKDYSEYWISNLFEISNNEGTSYYITLESANTKLILHSSDTSWNTYKKTSKI